MPSRPGAARGLILLALLSVAGFSVGYGRFAWEDSGAFAFVLFGVPLMCTVSALWVERADGALLAPAVVAVLGLVCLAWSLLTGLGIGLVFLLPSFLLLSAAAVSRTHRTDTDASASSGP
jgi:hypothetical protein